MNVNSSSSIKKWYQEKNPKYLEIKQIEISLGTLDKKSNQMKINIHVMKM